MTVLLHIVLLAGFYVFYRIKKARWTKLAGQTNRLDGYNNDQAGAGGLRHSGSISEVVSSFQSSQIVSKNYSLRRLSEVFTARKEGPGL